MNYDFYKTFVTLAETKNFSKAAEKLNIVQSTVSNRIQELEKYFGTDLFLRTNKSVSLTKAGQNFLPYAKRIVAIDEEGLGMINKLNYKDTIKIGTVHSFYSGYIKSITKKFMNFQPNISIEIILNHTPDLLQMLSDNLVDIGFVCAIPKSNKFTCLKIIKDEIILVAKNSNEYKTELDIADFKSIPLLYADTGDSLIEYIEEQLHTKLDFKFSINQILEIIDYVCEGYGYAFVLKSLVTQWLHNEDLKEVKIKNLPPCTVEGYVVAEKANIKKEVLENFINLLCED